MVPISSSVIVLEHQDLPPLTVKVVRRRRKRLSLVVEADGLVECRVPLRCAKQEIDLFVRSNESWLREVLAKQKLERRRPRLRFEVGAEHYFLGQRYRLVQDYEISSIKIVNGDLHLPAKADSPGRIQTCLEGWYRRQAQRLIDYRVDRLCAQYDLQPPHQIKIRKMKAKWGSCSASGGLCFNLWLITQDLRAIDYVIVHELCHLKHFDHSPAFYAYLGSMMPDWQHRQGLLV